MIKYNRYSDVGLGGIMLIQILNTNKPTETTCRLAKISATG